MLNGPPVPQPQTRKSPFLHALKERGFLALLVVRCHELKGNREGKLAVNLGHPYRLIFEPANNPIPRKPDGGLDWTGVTAIRVLTVEDYHG